MKPEIPTPIQPIRHFIELAFDGTRFNGWQVQQNAPLTVQATLDGALSTILRRPIETTGQGRTDTGVHASQFFAHFDGPINIHPDALAAKLNRLLPPDIAVYRIFLVNSGLHARFQATSRTYKYHIHTHKDPFLTQFSHFLPIQPNANAMNAAANHLLGFSDFAAFQKQGAQTHTTVCNLMQANWQQNDHRLIFTVQANRFLRNMVRAMVGTLLEIGLGKMDLNGLNAVMASGSRTMAGTSVDAKGLSLVGVTYPEGFDRFETNLFD